MGEIADSLIDGEFDFYTGEYLGEGVGYPRTQRRGKIVPIYTESYDFSDEGKIRGVKLYLRDKLKLNSKSKCRLVMEQWAKHKGLPVISSNRELCLSISDNWQEFKSFAVKIKK